MISNLYINTSNKIYLTGISKCRQKVQTFSFLFFFFFPEIKEKNKQNKKTSCDSSGDGCFSGFELLSRGDSNQSCQPS